MRLYLDTNILVDLIEQRNAFSYDLFMRSLRGQYTLVISSWALDELAKIGYSSESEALLRFLADNKNVVFVLRVPEDDVLARGLPTHFADAVHYAIARRSADALVTWNVQDFPFAAVRTPKDF